MTYKQHHHKGMNSFNDWRYLQVKRLLGLLMVVILVSSFASYGLAENRLRMSTTTSTENSGLLKVLLPPFEKANNVKVDVISVGTGKALEARRKR